MIDRQKLFSTIRVPLYRNGLSQKQVEGIDAVCDAWEAYGLTDLRWLAYILATDYHETGRTMQPVKEYGGEKYLKSKPYYPYYGRDLCQTTWKRNYELVRDFSGIDVVNDPEKIAQLGLAAKVIVHFMNKGLYTGKKLSDYFSDEREDWVNARKIINGKDRAELVSGYAKKFYIGLV